MLRAASGMIESIPKAGGTFRMEGAIHKKDFKALTIRFTGQFKCAFSFLGMRIALSKKLIDSVDVFGVAALR